METSKKKLNQEMDKIFNNEFSVDITDDEKLLGKDYNWNDLNKLKDELANSILEFVSKVNEIIVNKDIINNLKENTTHFNNLIKVFFTDINNFSNKIKELRLQHEHLTGYIKNLNEFNVYNRIAITYHSLSTELITLITPTITDIILTTAQASNNIRKAIEVNTQEENNVTEESNVTEEMKQE